MRAIKCTLLSMIGILLIGFVMLHTHGVTKEDIQPTILTLYNSVPRTCCHGVMARKRVGNKRVIHIGHSDTFSNHLVKIGGAGLGQVVISKPIHRDKNYFTPFNRIYTVAADQK